MEGLVIFIIVAIISTVLSRNKEGQQHSEQMPPFHQHAKPSKSDNEKTYAKPLPKQRSTVQSFEDFAKKFLGDLEETENSSTQSTERIRDEKPLATSLETGRDFPVVESQKKYEKKLQHQSNERMAVTTVVPNTRKALIQAVIMAEVLGLPKAKRK